MQTNTNQRSKRKKHHSENQGKRQVNGSENAKLTRARYEIICDALPLEEGGFRPGTRINSEEYDFMRTIGAFASGTVIYDRQEGEKITL